MYYCLSIEQVCEISAVELTDLNLIIVCIYRSNLTHASVFFPVMDRLFYKLFQSGKDCVILGDFNIDCLCPLNSDSKET